MDDRVQARLEELRAEFETGQRRLAELETQRAQLTETLLRISGAIQVLEELGSNGAATGPVGPEIVESASTG
jgi:predicted nuclease with TOPRIM domain